ncbi:anthranilate phosphoribosyltransferase [Enterococcus sp.]|uniref:anthranilate phosphoribosyltransferase n=1 Tax=Enterococcus sp. TaxID=35783 RepID=UPI0028A6C231|nr:anthranilate phosphoribosyltransferase [Enterococcus sp.]
MPTNHIEDGRIRLNEIQQQLFAGQDLTHQQMRCFAQGVLTGTYTESQLGAALIALKNKGITAEELTALAQIMREHAIAIPYQGEAMDNCGTGGDHANSFNISTTTAFVLAAGGITMAKHGNRSVSSRSGSADVLASLGVNIMLAPEQIADMLSSIGIAFLFAPSLHPGMKAVMKVRQELATPTIFNLLGPLINPVPLTTQLMGTYAGETLADTAQSLAALGRKRGMVIHGHQGMDEANLAGPVQISSFHDNKVEHLVLDPNEYGFAPTPIAAIVGGDATRNAAILTDVLQAKPSVYLETVVLNAGLGFYAHGSVKTFSEGFALARSCIVSGAAYDKLQDLITASTKNIA